MERNDSGIRPEAYPSWLEVRVPMYVLGVFDMAMLESRLLSGDTARADDGNSPFFDNDLRAGVCGYFMKRALQEPLERFLTTEMPVLSRFQTRLPATEVPGLDRKVRTRPGPSLYDDVLHGFETVRATVPHPYDLGSFLHRLVKMGVDEYLAANEGRRQRIERLYEEHVASRLSTLYSRVPRPGLRLVREGKR